MPRCALQATHSDSVSGDKHTVLVFWEHLRNWMFPKSFTAACKRASLAPAMDLHQLGPWTFCVTVSSRVGFCGSVLPSLYEFWVVLASGLYKASELWCVGFLGTGAVSGSAFSSKCSLIPWSCLAFVQGQPASLL